MSVLGEMAPGGLIRFFLPSSDGVTSYSAFYSQPRGSCLQRTQSRETHGFTLQLYPLCAVEKKNLANLLVSGRVAAKCASY